MHCFLQSSTHFNGVTGSKNAHRIEFKMDDVRSTHASSETADERRRRPNDDAEKHWIARKHGNNPPPMFQSRSGRRSESEHRIAAAEKRTKSHYSRDQVEAEAHRSVFVEAVDEKKIE